jgi:acetoin utilization deacetylase AcuC-like enzyme
VTTAFHYDPRYLEHDTGVGHPECPERLVSTMRHLKSLDWFDELYQVTATPAAAEALHSNHAPDYVARAADACARGAPYLDVPDVAVSNESYDIACLAVGSALALADCVVEGPADNGFALLRPPGHHAETATALGFCLFNNVAITARHLQRQHGLDKIAILDWDVHHGNGTQHSFETDPSVLYISLHQYPYYPGTGAYSETGSGAGSGATLNCPMPAGAGDPDYQQAFTEQILPKLEAFAPQAILLSAGFDAHRDDPLAQIQISTECYGWMTERLMETAERHAGGRVIALLEGGYNLRALPLCIAEHLRVLARK